MLDFISQLLANVSINIFPEETWAIVLHLIYKISQTFGL